MSDELVVSSSNDLAVRDEPENKRPELSATPANYMPAAIGGLVALLVILLFGGIGTFLYLHPETTRIIRDIFIIFLGLGVFVIILLLIVLIVIMAYLALKINDLVQLLDREIKPMLEKLQHTLTTIQGTATFLSTNAVQPVIKTASVVSATQSILRSLFKS